jgi:molecular chaperone GrpE (heat shock protein)
MRRLIWVAGLALLAAVPARAANDHGPLPRFTAEREAAARFFVTKHLPELLPVLDQLKKTNAPQYQRQVREIFQVTELLADLDDERRYDLELRIWKTENRAHLLVAHLSTPAAAERKRLEERLLEMAKELVELDVQVLELKAEQLDKELGEVKDELARAREGTDKQIKDRYEGLLDKARRRRK